MVYALINVVKGSTLASSTMDQFCVPQPLHCATAIMPCPSTIGNSFDYSNQIVPTAHFETCCECKINGCLGCNFFPKEKKNSKQKRNKKKYRGVR